MNICLLTSTYFPLVGGLEIVVHNLAKALSNSGHNVYVLTSYNKEKIHIQDLNYTLLRFGFKGYGRLKLYTVSAILSLWYYSHKYDFDLINVHNVFHPGTLTYYFKLLNKKIPIVGTPHGDDVQIDPDIQDGVRINPDYDFIVRRNLKSCTLVTSISSSIKSDLRSLIDEKKIIDIPNGIWVNDFINCSHRNEVRRKFDIPLDSVVIISVGRNHPRKGFEYGLKAIAKLKALNIHVTYILVGRSMDSIRDEGSHLSISDCLITPGQVDYGTIIDLLVCSDIYFSPSIIESFGMATLEAMCAGLPCVVTDIPGSRDLVSRDFGICVKSRDVDAMSTALKKLIENSALRREMGEKAHLEANKYNWPNVAQLYTEAYKKALVDYNDNLFCSEN